MRTVLSSHSSPSTFHHPQHLQAHTHDEMADSTTNAQQPWFLRYTFPISFPTHTALADIQLPQAEFESLICRIIAAKNDKTEAANADDHPGHLERHQTPANDAFTVVSSDPSTTIGVRESLEGLVVGNKWASPNPFWVLTAETSQDVPTHPFIQGLREYNEEEAGVRVDMKNKMFTDNLDLAYHSTTNPLLDLFTELEEVISGPRLNDLLNAAWSKDPLITLKIIFNARSIHLGKASRSSFYRCAGWLYQSHPLTLINNLRWLSRPIIEKKVQKKEDVEFDIMLVDEPEKDVEDEDDPARFDTKFGVAHGYWKDILNVLTLAVNQYLTVLAQPRDILNIQRASDKPGEKKKKKKKKQQVDKEDAKTLRHGVRDNRHDRAVDKFQSDNVYQALHVTVARLFAEQLKKDLQLLREGDAKAKKDISLCAKWAPSHSRFHDKHTFVISSVAELLYPIAEITGGSEDMDRESYLRHARERYRKDISALRAHLDVVERKIAAKKIEKINYDRVPSIAMSNYAKMFAVKDPVRFEEYLNRVAEGKMRISGATLLPSMLIKTVREAPLKQPNDIMSIGKNRKAAVEAKIKLLNAKVVDGQWKTLVQRIKDSGSLDSSIAVCDVSGSMSRPYFTDGTTPMDSAIGLSLLLAEVTAPPFGGNFTTFSSKPQVQSIDLSKSLHEKWNQLKSAHWAMNTDFVAVFERLILPMALQHDIKQEDMVKRVFVFSDMQFDMAGSGAPWSTSYERINRAYSDAGYEMPELVFWNLAGGRSGVAPKPVTAEQEGTAMVSGYSQGMLKVFLDNGSFEDPDEEGEVEVKTADAEDDEAVVVVESQAKKRKIDPMSTLKKAIGHKAYDPLKVMD
ncbi:hypothetical protein F4778DRAFT_760091 [Xylariomycetidae sp. FL2044]|nr:hypothetical protein F4778DRAFT_760091 [Xylariomycetidae sp. FL2044]